MEREQTKKENVKLGYPVLADAIALASEEIYSRFNAMLTANSIIIALIGLTLSEHRLPQPLPIVLPIAGLLLCIIWGFFNHQGICRQHKYMEEARHFEETIFCGDFKIWLFEQHRWLKYSYLSFAVIAIFFLIYVSLLVVAIRI